MRQQSVTSRANVNRRRFRARDRASRDPFEALADYLRGGPVTSFEPEQLLEHGLAGHAVARLTEAGAGVDPRLQTGRLALLARHMVMKREVTRLVSAWSDAGIEALLFKGFALAEWVYPEASWRSYSDIDVALRDTRGRSQAAMTEVAAAVAESLGLNVEGRPSVSKGFDSLYGETYNGPALIQLSDKTGAVAIDVHSRVVHNCHDESNDVAKAAFITRSVWERAQARNLAGVPVLVPSPVDSAVVGLILSRAWSTDSSRLRPTDYLDLTALVGSGVDLSTIRARARELGCEATVRLFLSRCNPVAGRLDLHPPNALTRFYFDTVHAPERGHRTLLVRAHEAKHLPRRAKATARALPIVLRHLRIWRAQPRHVWPAEALPSGAVELDREWWRLTQLSLRRAFQLAGVPHPERRQDLALACLMFALRQHGVPVIRRRSDAGDSLELDGEKLRPTVLGIRRA